VNKAVDSKMKVWGLLMGCVCDAVTYSTVSHDIQTNMAGKNIVMLREKKDKNYF
jgi:hypothetical protein